MGLIDGVTNNSGLALDPDLDSYYVMLSLQTNLPQLTEQMGTGLRRQCSRRRQGDRG